VKEKKTFGIHWFRRDLRVAGNSALLNNWKEHDGRVVGLFCFDSQFLSRSDFSNNRFAFFLETLSSLKQELRAAGGDLFVVDATPQKAFPQFVKFFERSPKWQIGKITYNRDYEPFARQRDREIEKFLKTEKVSFQSFRDHLIIEPEELFKAKEGEFYQVYSPFSKKWLDLFQTETVRKRIQSQEKGLEYLFSDKKKKDLFRLKWQDLLEETFSETDALDRFIEINKKKVSVPIPKTGSKAIRDRLEIFKDKIKNYKEDRDVPSIDGTSQFSMYLKNGSLTSAQIVTYFQLHDIHYKQEDGPARFLKEIIWREFYYHILFHRPDVENEAFLKKYKDIQWENNKEFFQKWCEGRTGFPLVDAGMRELNSTGWMHNRVRMVVSSFLIKDLLIDWRWGEKYFMEKLLDGDLAPNNGGWQWAASTGCDPQPYFRIFNPWLQAKKFDPDGDYIRRFVPELAKAPLKSIHDEEADRTVYNYPAPIVKHAAQKAKALSLYKL
jgi:deoxyribodipyrimidine photo-lyase